MRTGFWSYVIIGLLALPVLSGCSLPGVAAAAEQEAAMPEAPAVSAQPTATPIQHQDVPVELPPERSNQAGDHDSSRTAEQRRAPGGDRFTFDRFERPFNTETMDVYYPYLDIQLALVYQDDTWIYAVIALKDVDENQALSGRYAAEIDTDQDGRGDWLVLVDSPSGTDWSTDGVQVWFDSNNDVGDVSVLVSDEQAVSDGYEVLVFDSGQGDDPDLAWARRDPLDALSVVLAVKRTILDGDEDYMIGMWAGGALLDPASFDLNDGLTHEQAGASLVEFEYFYPVKALDQLDNSCRMAVGFTPSGEEPGLCPLPDAGPDTCPPEQFVCPTFRQGICICVGD